MPTLSPGTRFDHYKLLRPMGQSRQLWTALDERNKQLACLKIQKRTDDIENTDLAHLQFRRNLNRLKLCQHEHLSLVSDGGQRGDYFYLASENIEGTALRQLMEGDNLSFRCTIKFISQYINALTRLHQRGVHHLNMRPENLLIDSQGNSALVNYSLAIAPPNRQRKHSYLAPEQYTGTGDQRSDLYTLSLIFAELLALFNYSHQTPTRQLKLSFPEDMQRAPLNITIPEALAGLIFVGLRISPEDRFQNISEYRFALKKALEKVHKQGLMKTLPMKQNPPLASSSRSISKKMIAELAHSLSWHIGPVADLVVKRHVGDTLNIGHLINKLAEEIPHHEEKLSFLRRWNSIL